MNNLKSFYENTLNYDNISFGDYFRTVAAEAKRNGLIEEALFVEIKKEIGELLTSKIAAFTGYESTSVMRDTANEIFVSILYCLDVALFGCGSHEKAVEYINSNSVGSIFEESNKLLKRCIFEAVSLLVKLKKTRINYPDKAYNTTIDFEIMEYLKKYDVRYFAHGTKRVFKYNPINGGGGHRGIIHLKKVIENLTFENNFVNSYGENTVQDLCYGYCESNGLAYNDMGVNIYSLVLINAIFADLAGNKGSTEVHRSDISRVIRLMKKIPETEQKKLLYASAENISTDAYVTMSVVRLAGKVIGAVNNNEIEKMIYIGELG